MKKKEKKLQYIAVYNCILLYCVTFSIFFFPFDITYVKS
jgi:hypothetical protein